MKKRKSRTLQMWGWILALFLTSVQFSFGQGVSLQNPIGANSLCGFIKNVLNVILAIGVPIAVLFLVYAGFLFVLARGNQTKLAIAKRNFFAVVIGVAVFLGAWTIGQVVANTINSIEQSSGTSTPASFISCS